MQKWRGGAEILTGLGRSGGQVTPHPQAELALTTNRELLQPQLRHIFPHSMRS
jgi:hypothetical protein